MADFGAGVLVDPLVLFTLGIIGGTVFLVYWNLKNTESDEHAERKEGSRSNKRTAKKNEPKVVPKKKPQQVNNFKKGKPGSSKMYTHPHLFSNLKGHTSNLTGGDFSSDGKHFITASEVQSCFRSRNEEVRSTEGSENSDAKPKWITNSRLDSNTQSDTENSLASGSSGGLKSIRRRKNKRKKKTLQNPSSNSNSSVGVGPAVTKDHFRQLGLTEEQLHGALLPSCVDVEERILCGFPYATDKGVYVFKAQGYSSVSAALAGHTLVDAETNDIQTDPAPDEGIETEGSDYSEFEDQGLSDDDSRRESSCNASGKYEVSNSAFMYANSNLNYRYSERCKRCHQFFYVPQNGESQCLYHPFKAVIRKDGNLHYRCCNKRKENVGCTRSSLHVYHQLHSGLNGPLQGFLSTKPKPRKNICVFGLDCEMVYTSAGFELARLTLVTVLGRALLDLFVRPAGHIFDYNTQFSGITESDMCDAVNFEDARERVLTEVSRSDILVGHSVENDLASLKLIHRRVLDTSLLFRVPCQRGKRGDSSIPQRQGLKALVKKYLNQDIQMSDGRGGHCSFEDATASLSLVLFHLRDGTSTSSQSISKRSKVAPLPLVLQILS